MKLLWTAQKVVFKRSSSTNAYYYTPKFLFVKLIDPKGSVKFQQNRIMVTKFYFKPFFFNIINLQFVKKFILLLKIISYFVGRGYQPQCNILYLQLNNLLAICILQGAGFSTPPFDFTVTLYFINLEHLVLYHFGGADCPALQY